MEDYQQDAHQKPSTEEPKPLLTFWRLIGFSALLSLLIAAGLWLCSYSRTNCDRAASADVGRLGAVLERLGNELVDYGIEFSNDEACATLLETNALRYMVGPYYGWRGVTNRCQVLLRFAKVRGRWRVEAAALRGSHPAGTTSRYVYFNSATSEVADIMTGIVDARNGKSQDWNAYPYRESSDSPEMCYTESIVDQEKRPPAGRSFVFRVPKGVPCEQFLEPASKQ